jgi:hypothetical protein
MGRKAKRARLEARRARLLQQPKVVEEVAVEPPPVIEEPEPVVEPVIEAKPKTKPKTKATRKKTTRKKTTK